MPHVSRLKRAFAARPRLVTLTITHAELTDADAQQDFDFAAALPEGAHVLSAAANVTVAFTDGAAGTATCDLGISGGDTDAILDGIDLSTATGVLNAPKGIAPNGLFGGVTLALRVDGSVNLDTFTAGSVEIQVVYCVPKADADL